MISILLSVVAVVSMSISAMSLFLSGLYAGHNQPKESLISVIVSIITFITSLCIVGLV